MSRVEEGGIVSGKAGVAVWSTSAIDEVERAWVVVRSSGTGETGVREIVVTSEMEREGLAAAAVSSSCFMSVAGITTAGAAEMVEAEVVEAEVGGASGGRSAGCSVSGASVGVETAGVTGLIGGEKESFDRALCDKLLRLLRLGFISGSISSESLP